MTRTSKTTLDDLPDEVVLEVINWLVLATKKTKYPPIAKKFSILYVLSQVNRRFRIILKPILCRDLQFDDHMAFHLAEENFRDGVYDYGHLVKSIQIAQPIHFWDILTRDGVVGYPTLKAFQEGHFLFPNLESFECYDLFFATREMTAFTAAATRNLKTMSLIWDDNYSFISQERLPKLDSLRLWLQRNYRNTLYPFESDGSVAYTSITRLMLHNSSENTSGSRFLTHLLRSIEFPHLRVLHLQEPYSEEPDWIFDFVQRHSTLLEVNLDTGDYAVRFESIVKLIYGTGTWVLPRDAPQSTRKDMTTWSHDEVNPLEQPLNMDGHRAYTGKFAFSRRPLSLEATQWRSAFGSSHPRYDLTALAMEMEDTWVESDRGDIVSYFPRFVEIISRFSHLEELRLSESLDQKEVVFPTFMSDLSNALSRFPRLRKVSLHWPLNCFDWRVYEDTDNSWLPYLDEVWPPHNLLNVSIRVHDWEFPEDVVDGAGVEDNIRNILGLAEDYCQRLDEEDEHLALRAWMALHEADIRLPIKIMAERCPLLEAIEWYPRWAPYDQCVRWYWQVIRDKDGKVSRLKDELTWPHCLRGNPQPMLMLVGEELEYVQRSGLGRWLFS